MRENALIEVNVELSFVNKDTKLKWIWKYLKYSVISNQIRY